MAQQEAEVLGVLIANTRQTVEQLQTVLGFDPKHMHSNNTNLLPKTSLELVAINCLLRQIQPGVLVVKSCTR